MELQQLKTLLTLARTGHMTRAAAELHLTQPAISTQLARLEEELGLALFDRHPKGMTLTEAGRTFLPYAEEALARLSDGRAAVEQMAGLGRGTLTIGGGATATTYLLPPLLGEFHARYPGIRFYVREQPSQVVVEDVVQGKLDLGIVTLPLKGAPSPSLSQERLHVEPWENDELRLLVPATHPLAGRTGFHWAELDGTSLVLFEAGSAVRALIDKEIAQVHARVEIVMELRSIESIKQMVAQGIGAAFVSEHALGAGQQGLRCLDGPLRRQLAVIHRSDRTQSVAALAFLQLLGQQRGR